ncbi:mastermind-like protein 3 [Pelmatolapia mariae]|uniref:mastermind-like protein 3 n=1 Tax=Pelmatolapia mariae TaxID=158779 RepID=UPI002FE678DE
MGDFASPAAGPNGSICINNSMNPADASMGPAASVVGIPKHSTVVERLRQRIEACRKHHISEETRYQQAYAEQMEIDRRDTVNLYQRSLEQRAKKSASGSSGTKQPQSKQLDPDSASSAEQRNNTLIAVRGATADRDATWQTQEVDRSLESRMRMLDTCSASSSAQPDGTVGHNSFLIKAQQP